MIQPSRIQGRIWKAAIRSQNLPLIWEADDFPIQRSLNPSNDFIYLRPALLLFDMGTRGVNPYELCRWVRDHCPDTKVVLTNSTQNEVSPSERQWAINQGAVAIIPKFQRKSLIIDVTSELKKILDILECAPLDPEPLSKMLHQLFKVAKSRSPQSISRPSQLAQPITPKGALSFRGSSYTKDKFEDTHPLPNAEISGVHRSSISSTKERNPQPNPKLIRRYRGILIEE